MLRQFQHAHGGSYRTLDNRQDQEAAIADPAAFAAEGEPPRLIDEVHLGGDWLVRAIKISVDEDPRPGRFILSGSSRFLTVPTLSESLAGRTAFIDLWPLSMTELTGGPADFLSRIFSDPAGLRAAESPWTRSEYIRAIPGGAVVGIEVKATSSPGADTARHLHWLRERLGDRFAAGIVLHLGQRASSFGGNVHVIPVSALWGHAHT